MHDSKPNPMTVQEFAQEMRVSAETVRSWIDSGILPARYVYRAGRRIIRIRRDALGFFQGLEEGDTHGTDHSAGAVRG